MILAGISIQALTNQGIFEQAHKARKESQRAQVTEWLNLKLMEEQMYKPTGTAEQIIEATRVASNGNTELAKMGKKVVVDENTSTLEDGEQVPVYFYVQVDEDVYKVEIAGAKFIGELGKFPPVIKIESFIKTTNSITVQVATKRNEGGELKYYIKGENDSEYQLKATKADTETTHTFEELEQNKTYNIKLVAIAENEQTAEVIKDINLGSVPDLAVGDITFTYTVDGVEINENTWTNKKVTVTANTDEQGFTLQTSKDAQTWNSVKNQIFTENGQIHVRLWDGKNAAGTATITATAQDGSGKSASCTVTVKVPDGVAPSTATKHTATAITYSWAELSTIAKMISNNSAITNDTLEVSVTLNGTTKTIGVGDTATVDSQTVRILGFNHDTLTTATAYGTTTATGKAGISFEYVTILTTASMNDSDTNSGGWGNCALKSTLNSTTYNSLSIKSYIKQVQKEYIQTYNNANSKTYSSDYLCLLSCGEIWNNGYNGGVTRGYAIATEGSQYKYYKSTLGSTSYSSSTNITKKPNTSSPSYWWIRSPFLRI